MFQDLCALGFNGGEVRQPGLSPAQEPLPEQNRLPADGALPGKETEEWKEPFLQKAFPHQAAHFHPAFHTVHRCSSLTVGHETLDGATGRSAISCCNRLSIICS
ncbi:MAG: hypothetical protein ABR898_08460 [Terracidiphilus sp.]